MAVNQLELRTKMTVSSKVRWLVGATGCLTAITGSVVLGSGFVVVPGFLIVGSLLAGRFPRIGRDLIWFGVLVLSLITLPVGILILLKHHFGDGTDPRLVAGAWSSIVLVVLCDTALVMEVFKMKPAQDTEKPDTHPS